MNDVSEKPRPGLMRVLARGFRRRCPDCGGGRMFRGYLKVEQSCSVCGEQLGHIRADDMPPYITVLIVGHIVVASALMMEKLAPQPMMPSIVLWCSVTVVLIGILLPLIKGTIVGFMWRLGLRGDEYQ